MLATYTLILESPGSRRAVPLNAASASNARFRAQRWLRAHPQPTDVRAFIEERATRFYLVALSNP